MTNMQSIATETRPTHIGAKLQSARELLRLDRKDAAAQLRLNENIIDMIESNSFPDDMPPLFIRGYIRSYGKLLQLPEDDISAALAPIKPKAVAPEAPHRTPSTQMESISSHKYLMQGLTAGIAVVSLWMVASWWHGRSLAPSHELASINQPAAAEIIAPAGVSVQLAKANPTMPTELPVRRESDPEDR